MCLSVVVSSIAQNSIFAKIQRLAFPLLPPPLRDGLKLSDFLDAPLSKKIKRFWEESS